MPVMAVHPKLTLFTKTGCPWCVDATRFLDEQGFVYEEVDVRRDPAGLDMLRELSGQTFAPTLLVSDGGDGLVLPDFGVPELEAFLEKHGISP